MKTSVIVPAYNCERFLNDAVQSVIRTGYSELEVLIVEDGSKDNTLAVARKLRAANADHVRLLRHKGGRNRGAGASRNLGIEAANGEVVAFLDADDWYLPNRFDVCIQILTNNPDVDGVYETTRVETGKGADPVSGWTVNSQMKLCESEEQDLTERVLKGAWTTNAITMRRKVLLELGGFRENLELGQDIEMWVRISIKHKLVEGDRAQPVAVYRRHSRNRSNSITGRNAMASVLGYSIQETRSRDAPEKVKVLEKTFHQHATRRLGWLVENGKFDEAGQILYWTARLFPKLVFTKHYIGNLRKYISGRIASMF